MIRPATPADAPAICDIYNYYVENTIITFETTPVSPEDMKGRIEEVLSSLPFYVYEEEGKVLGYAYASKWKGRCAYRFSTEATVYLQNGAAGKGIGTKLYQTLLDDLKERKIHAVLGGIALPNKNSVALHEKFGFEKAAHFKEVGNKFDKWIDVGYWELIF